MSRVIWQIIWKSIIEQKYLTGIGIWMLVAHVMLCYNNSTICMQFQSKKRNRHADWVSVKFTSPWDKQK